MKHIKRFEQHLEHINEEYAPQEHSPDLKLDNLALYHALCDLVEIIENSRGVDGWHRNGDIATWDEFEGVNDALTLVARLHKKYGTQPDTN